jgi:hypothetical protein
LYFILSNYQVKLANSFKEYRMLHGAHVRNPGALIYPTSLKYMTACVLGLIKCNAFRWVLGFMGLQLQLTKVGLRVQG